MMIKEFTKLTGFHPSASLAEAIQEAYYEFDGDKAAFCKAYKENADGIAERIQHNANMADAKAHIEHDDKVKKLKAEIESLKAQLEREQEWHELEDDVNVKQDEYDHLKNSSGTRVLTDEEAKDLLYEWFGFAREKITIHHAIDKHEVNRHRVLRKIGEIERLPLYNATDWNYIRFDCGCMSYEFYNDSLRSFVR